MATEVDPSGLAAYNGGPDAMSAAFLDLVADREAELDPELAEWVEEGEWGPMLRHPLVYMIPLSLPGMANKSLAAKQGALSEALAAEEWSTVVFLHERAHRLSALIDYCTGRDEDGAPLPLSSVAEHWTLAAEVWVDSENIEQCQSEWEALFGDCNIWLGTEDELAEFNALPDPVPAWRGEIDDGGWSYSTDEKIARWFAARFGGKHGVIQEDIPKSRVFGYLTRRGESELLVCREQVSRNEEG